MLIALPFVVLELGFEQPRQQDAKYIKNFPRIKYKPMETREFRDRTYVHDPTKTKSIFLKLSTPLSNRIAYLNI
ncbi:MAG: hypothetical protein SynsKO_07920 [Synoicihabitans sp.]